MVNLQICQNTEFKFRNGLPNYPEKSFCSLVFYYLLLYRYSGNHADKSFVRFKIKFTIHIATDCIEFYKIVLFPAKE